MLQGRFFNTTSPAPYPMTSRRLLASSLLLAFSIAARADVLINEIMYHPSSENPAEEYIELYNSGAAPVTLTGWKFTNGVTFTFPASSIAAGGYLVVAANQAAFTAKYPGVTNYVAGWTGQLSNSSNKITLTDPLLLKMDEVDYSDDGDWGQRERDVPPSFGHRGWGWNSDADGLGKSLELINALFDNSAGQNWKVSATAQGTPGVANSVAASDIAPIITDASHFPLIPSHTDTVAVFAKMTDDHAATITATLHWRLDGGSFATATMFDDGTHGDGAAGDGVYGAILLAQANNSIVEFYYQAADTTGHTRTWPAPAKDYTGTFGQFCNCLYQVDDAVYAGAQPIYRLVMKAADKTELNNINTNTGAPPFAYNAGEANDQTYSHARFNTTFVSRDGTGAKLRYLTGTRNRGNGSRSSQPQSLNVQFANADAWNGIHGLNLNTQHTPFQLFGSSLFRKAGLTMAESRAVQVHINGTNSAGAGNPAHGFYVCNEVQDTDFADHHFPTDSSGNIYRVFRTDSVGGGDLRDQSAGQPAVTADPTPYRVNYYKDTNVSEDRWNDLIGLTKALAKGHAGAGYTVSYDADFTAQVEAAVDVPQWMRFFAVALLSDNSETNLATGDGDDYFLYFGITDPRAQLISYDLDTLFHRQTSTTTPGTVNGHGIFRMCEVQAGPLPATPVFPLMIHPKYALAYFQEMKRLLDGPFSPAEFNALADEVLGPVWDAPSIQAVKDFNAGRTAFVAGLMPLSISSVAAQTTAGTALTVTSGYPRSTAATCRLIGKADCTRTASVKVNGFAATYTPWQVTNAAAFTTSIGDWSAASVTLTPGVNRLHIQAFDSTGAEIEQSFFDVWYDDASVTTVNAPIAANTTWTAAGGPYQVTAALTVNSGVTLTIQPGTSVYLNSAIGITVAAGGRIIAEGTAAQPIRFTRAPGLTTNGGTITINGQAGAPETHFYYTFFEFGGDPAVVCAANSNVILDHCEWLRTDVAYLHLDGGSFIVSHCIFPTAAAGANFEGVHGANAAPPAGGRAIVHDSFFGRINSASGDYNDVMDFTGGNRPGPILQFYNNVMTGSDDDLLDIDGTDLWCEGNIFMHVHRRNSPDSASAISGGNDGGGGTGSRRAATAIDTATDQITCGTHGFTTGQEVAATALLGNTFPAATPALHDGGPYYVRAISGTVVKLYLTAANANADTNAINFTGTIGAGVSLSLCKLDGISHITIVGNLFYDMDQAATAKEGNFYTFLNNTVISQNNTGSQDTVTGVLNFGDDTYHESGGMYAEGNIIQSAVALTRNYPGAGLGQTVVWNNNLFPPGLTWSGAGSGNLSADSRLNDTVIPTPNERNYERVAAEIRQKFGLQPGSPARGTGPNGSDKGGVRPIGVSIGGAPSGTTNATNATLTIGTNMSGNGIPSGAGAWVNGSGWTHYKWRLNGGAWSAETPVATPISISGLAIGTHTVAAAGRNDAGTYQDSTDLGTSAHISSATWIVDTGYIPPVNGIRINEVLAKNVETQGFSGTFPDIIELYNAGSAPVVLDGWGLTDNNALPYKYAIPAGTTLNPGAYLVIYGSNAASVPLPKTGFGLKDTGDTLTLTKSAAAGGTVADAVPFGAQIPDYSIGRRATDGAWDMCRPTFGAVNVVAGQSSLSGLKINEWLADAVTLIGQDFVELYNPNSLPVNIGGCYLSDNPVEFPARHQIRQLTFLAAGGYTFFKADDDVNQGPEHVNFKLDALQGEIGFFSPAQVLIDNVVYGPQSSDVSQGRTPNGADTLAFFNQPTPGAPNPGALAGSTTTVPLMAPTQVWKYFANASAAPANDGSGRAFTHPLYTDAAWPSGGGVLYIESSAFPANTDGFAKTTALPGISATVPYQTYYFRTHFNFSGPVAGTTLTAKLMCDDGCVIYLNGVEITPTSGTRVRMDPGAAGYATLTNGQGVDASGGAGCYETYTFTNAQLLVGDNVLAVSVHQSNDQSGLSPSSDITWGLKLSANVAVGTSAIVVNEVLPINSSGAGWIELLNTSGTAIDISDMSLTNDVSDPRKYVFAAGTTIAANSYRVLDCNSLLAASATNTHFDLTGNGGGVFLFRKVIDGGGLQDSVSYGLQVPDFSLGRTPNGSGAFALNVPTRSALNSAAGLGAITTVKFNEWLVSPNVPPGWFEIYNTGAQPVQLSGNFFTDLLTNRTKFQIPALTFVGGSGTSRWQQWIADNNNTITPGHVNFTLAANQNLGLFSGSGVQLDARSTGAPGFGISQGLLPDGTGSVQSLTPTPAAANQLAALDTDGDGIPDAYEIANGLNPNDPLDAALDRDGDGKSNLAEYLAGTDPNNPLSVLTSSIAKVSGVTVVRFTAAANKGYTIQFKNTLLDLAWQKLTDIAADPSVRSLEIPDPAASGFPARFYRVVTPIQP